MLNSLYIDCTREKVGRGVGYGEGKAVLFSLRKALQDGTYHERLSTDSRWVCGDDCRRCFAIENGLDVQRFLNG